MAESSISDDELANYLLTRGTDGLNVLKLSSNDLITHHKISDSMECFCWGWSRHGDLLAYCDRKSVYVLDGSNYNVKYELQRPLTRVIEFSPKGTYLCLWEPYVVRHGESTGQPNLVIYKGSDRVIEYYQKKQEGCCPQWSDDECICARNVNNEVHFFDGCPGASPSSRLQHENLTTFSLSPGPPYHIAVHIKGSKVNEFISVQLYQYPRVAGPGAVIANKSFYKADTVQLKWNKSGNGVLVLTTTDVDKTGSSYYGEQNIYYLSVKGEGNMIPLDKKGPVYCIEWNPNGREFCVVYGFMPSKAALFNSKCDKIHDFGISHRNTALYNPQGNNIILCLAGFGNLRGNMEFWNMETMTKLSDGQASDTTSLSWCPDGVHLITATTAPRLREGNGYKLWHFSSVLLREAAVPPKKELWAVDWKPRPPSLFPPPDLSAPPPVSKPIRTASSNPKQQAYVPPSLRGKPRPPNESGDVAQSKNKRKRDAQKKAKQHHGEEKEGAIATAEYLLKQDKPPSVQGGQDNEKKIKNLKKKLKQIEDLKGLQATGKKLEANQIQKIKSEESLLQELSLLEIN